MTERLGPAFFDDLYAADPDPWKFASSPYEAAKYDATIEALQGRRFTSALEIGCSIGVLTDRLSAHCDTLLAIDVAEAALDQAKTARARTSPSSAARCRRSSPTAATT